jgi:hypothetical protein
MKLTVENAQREYQRLSVVYFADELPDVEIEVVRDLRAHGGTRSRIWGQVQKDGDIFRIELLAGMPWELWVVKLAHEMLHVKLWPKSHRSKEWRDEVARLGREGLIAEVF